MKSRLKSKTLWFNYITAILIVVEAQLHVLTPLVSASLVPFLLLGIPIANAILREFTREPLK